MASEKQQVEEESSGGAPDWMVTFSDCMTLLLTFFVLLLSFSSFDDHTFETLGTSFAQSLPSIGKNNTSDTESIWKKQESRHRQRMNKGTETRPTNEDTAGNFMKEKKPLDFRNLKVFTVPSSQVFWGTGTAISKTGQEMLDAFGTFLKSAPSRVVISESSPDGDNELGLRRSWAVVEYVTRDKEISKDKFSITASGVMGSSRSKNRFLTITMLERSVYE